MSAYSLWGLCILLVHLQFVGLPVEIFLQSNISANCRLAWANCKLHWQCGRVFPSATCPGGSEATQPLAMELHVDQKLKAVGCKFLPALLLAQLSSVPWVSICPCLLVADMWSCLAGKAAVVVFLFCHSQNLCSLPRQITWKLQFIPTANFLPKSRSHIIFFKSLLTKMEYTSFLIYDLYSLFLIFDLAVYA